MILTSIQLLIEVQPSKFYSQAPQVMNIKLHVLLMGWWVFIRVSRASTELLLDANLSKVFY